MRSLEIPLMKHAEFQFYAELIDFLDESRKDRSVIYSFKGCPAVKDSIEALGVPHVEVDAILVNGVSVDFTCQLQDGDCVSVYPASRKCNLSKFIKLLPAPQPEMRFVLDVHLGFLAGKLRMLGFDTLYCNDYNANEIVEISVNNNRTILTHDRGILMRKIVSHGYWIRSMDTEQQLPEVLKHFQLYSKVSAFHRCISCNGLLKKADKEVIKERLQPKTDCFFDEFFICSDCSQIYWKGSHYYKMKAYIQTLLHEKS
ncbi:MAG: Mut7-C RNAse domain-containing protein [Kiritimatiellia bacterium]